ncbi:type IV pilus assembly protein PilY1 [Variovorax boronicumulans]|uniref:pilus assembly protein n=1 Tax=Variovorax boronicumulans TaxID=436515 RepID=UPI002784CCC3|nr:PilC/PilY family type IV pilus protein [Variovorax boronicumulans]MDQ0073245.1 type IV pilus assembly protein PilY1 [Variovorax boronicumulans]
MKSFASNPRPWFARPRTLAWLATPLVAAVLAVSIAAISSTAPNIKPIALASDPLYATTSGDKPALALALSVEYPTVGAQYTPSGDTDNTYSNLTEYIGYYDANACYSYNNAPIETPATGLSAADYKRFDRIPTNTRTDRKCDDGFSGNFLNWASSSAIDMLRLALSGGDRYVDTTDLTILQRAVLPNGDPICMWNSTNFPAKQLTRDGGGSGSYWGAVPRRMITAAGTNDIWVANTLNKIYFGTARGGSCTSTGSYSLSTNSTGTGPFSFNGSKPAAATKCADENGTCSFNRSSREIWYGAGTSWMVGQFTNSAACTNAVFSDPVPGTVKACYSLPANTTPRPVDGLNSDGFFYSRVKVCDKDSAGNLADARDYTFCTKYPSGNYKPTGTVQKYSDQLRLSAFGYLMDQTNSGGNPAGRYGGVLRAPMKYVGTKTFDINGIDNTPTGGNTAAEWNATTGVFAANPDSSLLTGVSAGFGVSGVVNYLNKFGRTGPTPGRYKQYDPVSELYYESLRYLQGLQPSDLATQNLTTAMYDGYPVFSSWSDPYGNGRSSTSNYACLKSNIVVIGDINTHDGNYRFPNANPAANIPDVRGWTNTVRAFEQGTNTNYVDGQGAGQQTTGNPSANTNPRGESIIGHSYWAHTHDIRGTAWTDQPTMQRPGLRVKSFFFDVNEYGDQNSDATRRNRNQFFTSAKYGGFESDPANTGSKPFNTYGNPFRRQDGTVDANVWQDPARPGEASTYYLQSSARSVLSAFDSIFSRASTSARSIAGSAVQSKSLQTSNAVYQGAFDTSDWSGDLLAQAITISNGAASISSTATWSASARLALMSTPATSRNIVIGRPGNAVPKASTFLWGSLTEAQQADLNKITPSATADTLGSDRVSYLRGSNAREGSPFRRRNNKLLGDIINSGVVYSGAPVNNINSSTYAAFRTANLSRTAAVFVGANDGMLHAFNAGTGDELFGYIPSWMTPKLGALTDPNYVTNHQSYVDGPPVVAEAQVGSAGTSADWKTVLVSGTGAGGRGVFALDVTDPTAFSASKVMWEFTQDDDIDMGFVVGQPQILKMRTSAPSATTATYKWFAVVASGVNNYTKVNAAGNYSTGNPALFLLDLSKAPETAWTLGSNYYKVELPFDATLAITKPTGVLNFKAAIATGGNREVAQIFAGDLHGNMWKLDFASHGTSEWNMANLSAFKNAGSNNAPYPLFVAKDGSGNVQPISMAPTLVAATNNTKAIQVAFGTGKYLETDDRASTAQNTFYVIYDNGTTVADATPLGSGAISGRGRLRAATITSGAISVPAFTWGRATADLTTSSTVSSGWYLDYATSKERQVSGALLTGDTLIFGSLIPGTAGDSASCGVSGGSGNSYIINVDTGSGTRSASTVGIMGQPLVIEVGNSIVEISNSTGRRTRQITSQTIAQGSGGVGNAGGGTGGNGQTVVTIIGGRLSWRQINNYLDLKRGS